jgi:PAS domain-containing protein
LVLDSDLTIRFANRSFRDTSAVAPEDALGRKLCELGNREWDIPELRVALETVVCRDNLQAVLDPVRQLLR